MYQRAFHYEKLFLLVFVDSLRPIAYNNAIMNTQFSAFYIPFLLRKPVGA